MVLTNAGSSGILHQNIAKEGVFIVMEKSMNAEYPMKAPADL